MRPGHDDRHDAPRDASAVRAFDTHCHLNHERYDTDRDAVLARARRADVVAVLTPAVHPSRWGEIEALVRAHRGHVYGALGVHPWALESLDDRELCDALAQLTARIASAPASVCAVGECGLDALVASRGTARGALARQIGALEVQCAHAKTLDLPVILHVVRAHDAALAVLRATGARGVLHASSASREQLRAYLDMGFYVSFAGALTRPSAPRLLRAAQYTPADRLLLESDGPDQLPHEAVAHGADPRRCEPVHLWHTARVLARVRAEPLDALVARAHDHAQRLFRPRTDAP